MADFTRLDDEDEVLEDACAEAAASIDRLRTSLRPLEGPLPPAAVDQTLTLCAPAPASVHGARTPPTHRLQLFRARWQVGRGSAPRCVSCASSRWSWTVPHEVENQAGSAFGQRALRITPGTCRSLSQPRTVLRWAATPALLFLSGTHFFALTFL